MAGPFVLEERLGRIFLLNQDTGALWEIEREKYTVWACAATVPERWDKLAPVPAPSNDRNELVGTDVAVVNGVTYHGQFQPTNPGSPCVDPPDPGEPDGEGTLQIRQREGLHVYTLLFDTVCPTRDFAWAEFDKWIAAERLARLADIPEISVLQQEHADSEAQVQESDKATV